VAAGATAAATAVTRTQRRPGTCTWWRNGAKARADGTSETLCALPSSADDSPKPKRDSRRWPAIALQGPFQQTLAPDRTVLELAPRRAAGLGAVAVLALLGAALARRHGWRRRQWRRRRRRRQAEGARGALAPGAVHRGLLRLAHGGAQALGRVARVGGGAGGGQVVSHLRDQARGAAGGQLGTRALSGRVRFSPICHSMRSSVCTVLSPHL